MPLPRLALTPGVGHGSLDGAWWPRCDVLELELPSLVGSLAPGCGAVIHVTVGAAAWPHAPRTVMAPGHVIEVTRADTEAETHVVSLDCGTMGHWELLVIPSDEPAGAATRLLAAVADPSNPLTAQRMPAFAVADLLEERPHGT
ncbi:DUF5994 family protein [Streptomyces sp. NPDC002577]